jgi:hypothetical protein
VPFLAAPALCWARRNGNVASTTWLSYSVRYDSRVTRRLRAEPHESMSHVYQLVMLLALVLDIVSWPLDYLSVLGFFYHLSQYGIHLNSDEHDQTYHVEPGQKYYTGS